jgi:hypothetical protein
MRYRKSIIMPKEIIFISKDKRSFFMEEDFPEFKRIFEYFNKSITPQRIN